MKQHIGSSFASFLEEKGIKDDVELRAQKEILAEQIREAMERKGVSFSALASSMGTSRTVVYRLLDPSDTGVTLETLSRVARALGLGLKVSLARAPSGSRARLRRTA
jgi:DNA-binding phage protein